MYETIASPVNYGGIRLKNRIIFAPTTLGLKGEAYQAKLQEIARGGCAMIIVGDVPVLPHGFGPSLYSKKGFAFYKASRPISALRRRFTGKAAWCAPSCTSRTPT